LNAGEAAANTNQRRTSCSARGRKRAALGETVVVVKRLINVLNDGRNQLVRIQRGFELKGDEAV